MYKTFRKQYFNAVTRTFQIDLREKCVVIFFGYVCITPWIFRIIPVTVAEVDRSFGMLVTFAEDVAKINNSSKTVTLT